MSQFVDNTMLLWRGGVCSHLCLCIISMSIHPLMIVFHEISMLMSLKCATGKVSVMWFTAVFQCFFNVGFHWLWQMWEMFNNFSNYDIQIPDNLGTTGSTILTLLSVASDIYSKMNYDDVDCQKKIICEFMEQPDMFGKNGLDWLYHQSYVV